MTVTAIRNLLAAGRVVEAQALLTAAGPTDDSEELRGSVAEIEQRLTRAAALATRAETMEREGKSGEAKALYEAVLLCAADFPGIREQIKRMDEALLLTRAVQRRGKRLRQSQPAGEDGASKRTRLLPWAGLGAGLAVAALLLVPVAFRPPLPEKGVATATVPAIVPQSVPSAAAPPPTTPAPQDEPIPPQPVAVEIRPFAADPEAAQPTPLPPEPTEAPARESLPPQESPPQEDGQQQPHPPAATPTGEQPATLYTVRPGDSLSLIAERELCNELAWQQLYQLNRDRIATPNRLLPGMVLRLTGLENRCPPAR
nr:LysM domain-containing protein [Desulfobulbus elongatus]